MRRIGIVGTGIMGAGMVTNYLAAGYPVTIWNRTPHKTKILQAAGAVLADSPRAVVEQSDLVFEVTADDASSQAVWQGKDGIIAGTDKNKMLVTSATLSIAWTEQLSQLCSKQGLAFFDMPLTGGR